MVNAPVTASELALIPNLMTTLGGGYDVERKGIRVRDVLDNLSRLVSEQRRKEDAHLFAWETVQKSVSAFTYA